MDYDHDAPILTTSPQEIPVTEPASEIGSASADRAIQMATALAAEVAVLRERLGVLEILCERGGVLPSGAIDHFRPDPTTSQKLRAERLGLIERVFNALRVDNRGKSL